MFRADAASWLEWGMLGSRPHMRVGAMITRGGRRVLQLEPVLLATLLLIVLGAWGFIELADEVSEGETRTFDESIILRLREPGDLARPIGPSWLETAAIDITAVGGFTVLTLLVVGTAGYLLLSHKRHAMWLVLIASGTGYGLTMWLKELFGRERPSIVPHLVEQQSMSFPSGHAMMSAVVYLTLGVLLAQLAADRWATRLYLLGCALLITLLVGISRVFLGVHYPTDVLAGWAAGLVWAILCWLVARWLQRRGVVEKPEQETSQLHRS